MVTYLPLWETLSRLGVSKTFLAEAAGITPSTMARFSRNENVSLTTIEKICETLNVQIEDVVMRENQGSLHGTFRPNKHEPVHRWYPYLEGYSRQLVEYELRDRNPGDVVYDPFAGSGTTPLTAVMNGIDGLYSEVNPVMRFISDVKLSCAVRAMDGDIDLSGLRRWRDRIASINFNDINSHQGNALGDFSRFFDADGLVGIQFLRECIDEETDESTKDLLKVVLASIVVPVSLMIRRGDLRFANAGERDKSVLPFQDTTISKIDELLQDLERMEKSEPGAFRFVSEDVRDSNLDECVDVVVTSPPYLNGTNYFRNTKLEMRVLDIIESENELGGFYQRGITAGINNVSSRREYPCLDELELDDLVERLQGKSYDTRIPVMVAGYFADMKQAIDKIRSALKPHGILSFDIGDSQFAGVHVPTHSILDGMIQQAGLRPLGETVLRARRSRNGMTLTQRVMRYVKE